jgi:hypothetical protein
VRGKGGEVTLILKFLLNALDVVVALLRQSIKNTGRVHVFLLPILVSVFFLEIF